MKPVTDENGPPEALREVDVLSILATRRVLVEPFAIDRMDSLPAHLGHGAVIDARWRNLSVRFLAHITTRGSPRGVRTSIALCRGHKSISTTPSLPLIVAPYLSDAALDILEAEGVSGVDLCGNGVIIEHERFLVRRSGAPNAYPANTPIRNPYRGQAGVVVRALISREHWPSLKQFHAHIASTAAPVSLSLCSKVITALTEDELVIKDRGILRAIGYERILDQLEHTWDRVRLPSPIAFAVSGDPLNLLARHLHGRPRWVVSGASSVARYTTLAQGGPIRVLVDDVTSVAARLDARREDIPAFAPLQLQACDEPGAYFDAVEHDGIRWASPVQTWLELRNGDARQREASIAVYRQIRQPHG